MAFTKVPPLKERRKRAFWERVDKGRKAECWLWQGGQSARNYALFRCRGLKVLAHRFSYELHHCPVPEDHVVIRICSNRMCVNPHHLKLTTRSGALQRAAKEGRLQRGTSKHNAKLERGDVIRIRHRYWILCESAGEIAKDYPVSRQTIWLAAKGKKWKHVPMPRHQNRVVPNDPEKVPARKRFKILRRDGYRCQICGRTAKDGVKLHIDHKIPRSKGGTEEMSNLWVLCAPCNMGKSNLSL